jgi:predicted nucleic acid-binding protein
VLLLDAGVWVALGEPESEHHSPARGLVREVATPLAALDLTLYEVADVVGARKGRHEDAARIVRLLLTRCRHDPLTVDADLLAATLRVAAQYRLTAYDAAYVAAAERHEWTLVSTDVRDLVSKGLAITPGAALYP